MSETKRGGGGTVWKILTITDKGWEGGGGGKANAGCGFETMMDEMAIRSFAIIILFHQTNKNIMVITNCGSLQEYQKILCCKYFAL